MRRQNIGVAALPMTVEQIDQIEYRSPAKMLESIVGAIHCALGGSTNFLWKGSPYTFHKKRFVPVQITGLAQVKIQDAFTGANVEILETGEDYALIRQEGVSRKYRVKDMNGTVVMERVNLRKKKRKCERKCPFNQKGTCHYDPMSDESPSCSESERMLFLGMLESL